MAYGVEGLFEKTDAYLLPVPCILNAYDHNDLCI